MRAEFLDAIRRRALHLAALVVALIAVSSCSSPSQQSEPAPSNVRRIISLSPALTEILFAVDAGDRVVGVTDYCDYPPEARTKPKVGGYSSPSVEAILGLKPDLVLVSPGPGNRDAAAALQRAGVRIEVIPAETVAESLSAIETVGKLCDAEARGLALVTSIRTRLDAVASRRKGEPAVPALFSVQIEPIIAAGAGTLPSEICEIAGGRNVVTAPRYPRLGIESVIAAAPQVILQTRMDSADATGADLERRFWERWPAIPAVRNGRVIVLANPIALRPGPRIAEAAEELERILHESPPPPSGRGAS